MKLFFINGFTSNYLKRIVFVFGVDKMKSNRFVVKLFVTVLLLL